MISLNYSLSFKDFLIYNIFHFYKLFIENTIIKVIWVVLVSLIVICWLLTGYCVVEFDELGLFVLIFLSIMFYTVKKSYNNSPIRYEFNFVINENEIFTKSEISEGKILFKGIVKAYSFKKYYYLYISKSQAFIIPKRVLNSSQQEEFNQILKHHNLIS